MSISDVDFDFVRKLVRERAAIVLEDGKQYLVETRLGALAEREGLASLAELLRLLRGAPPGAPLTRRVVEAMTTNESSFFRDGAPFAALRQTLLPELIRQRSRERSLSIWSCACSSGQEPYSVAMLLDEHFPELSTWKVRILATDLSTEMLARARAGVFSALEVSRGLPTALLHRYFEQRGADWQIDESLRRRIDFRELNLIGSWPALPKADLILLRNVLIYFDVETKQKILAKARQQLRPDGIVLLGSAETTINLDDAYVQHRADGAVFYRVRP
ncbi:MAG TPA: protein-glutamate O-methyltransferase CheR [Polyangiaceae bacterium]|nr:protein-glutamate O-methyltransferase CheR [Polyangiaceae bacterium]